MPNPRPAGPTPRATGQSIEVPREATEYTPERYAAEARERYERDPERPKSFLEKASEFVRKGVRSVMHEFQEGGFLKKAAIVAGVGGLALLGVNVIRKAASALGNAFGSIFRIGEWVKEKLSGARTSTVESILKWTLVPLLGITTVSAIYKAVKGNLSLTEILQTWRTGGLTGLGALLLQKEREGLINMGKDAANALSERLGLPSVDSVREQVSRVREEVDQGISWLDEKTHFSQTKEALMRHLRDIGVPVEDWIEKINLAEIAKDLGISKDNETSWQEYLLTGGAAYLIWKWIGLKGLSINAGLYLFLLKNGKESFLGKMTTSMGEQLNSAKEKILDKLKDVPGVELLIMDEFENFDIKKSLEEILDWAKENRLEALLTLNGLWIGRFLIWNITKKLGKSLGNALVYAFNNPGKAAIAGFVVAALYAGKREFVQRFVDAMYDDDEQSQKAAEEMRNTLDSILGIDRSKPEGLHEKQIPAFVESLIEDPMKILLESPQEIIDALKEGKIAFGVTMTGEVLLLIRSISLPIQLTKLTWEAFRTSFAHIISPENEGNLMVPMLWGGVEAYVFGTAAWHGFKAYQSVLKSAGTSGKMIWRGLMAGINPVSKEWRFVMRSAIAGPFMPMLKLRRATEIGKIISGIEQLNTEIAQTSPNFTKIEEIARGFSTNPLFKDFSDARRYLLGTDFDFRYGKNLDAVQSSFSDIANDAVKKKAEGMKEHLDSMKKKIGDYDTALAQFLKRVELVCQGRISEAVNFSRDSMDFEEKIHPLETSNLFEGKTEAELQARKTQLETEITSSGDPKNIRQIKIKELAAIETYLDPDSVAGAMEIRKEFTGLTETDRAAKLEEWAARIEGFDKGMHQKFAAEMDEIVKEAKMWELSLSDPKMTAKLRKLDTDLILPFRVRKEGWLKALNEEYKKLPRNLRTTRLKSQMRLAVQGAEGNFLTKATKGMKGRMKLAAVLASAMFVTETALESREKDTTEAIIENLQQLAGRDGWQLLMDVMPISGTLSSLYSIATGTEALTGNETSRLQNAFWGVAGAAGDAFMILSLLPSAGTSLGANIMLRLTRLAGKGIKPAQKLIESWPIIEKAVEASGGWYEFCKKVLNYIQKDKGKIAHGLRIAEGASVLTGTTLMVGGVAGNLFYGLPESDIPEIDLT